MPVLLQLAPVRAEIQAQLDAAYTIHHYGQLPDTNAWIAAHGPEIDGVVTGGHNGIPTPLMDALPNLKIVAINGVGYDRIDVAAAKARGIRVTNTPDVLTDDVADLAIGLTIGVMRRLHTAHNFVAAGHWPIRELGLASKVSGKRFGIFGMGRIGQAVAHRLAAFAGTVSYTGPAAKPVPYCFIPTLLDLARDSDVLVVCAAASAATRGIINRAVLDALGPDGTLVNIARGSIIDEPALIAALQEGRLGAAGLDVFADEPHVPPAFLSLDNVLLTPHIASATDETRRAMGRLMFDNLDAYFSGRPLLTPVI